MSLTDTAISKIKEMILDGRLAPGSKLPREADLAEDLGISRNSLREAVRALSLIRILDVRQGDGTYVTSLQPEILMETMGFIVDFHHDAIVLHLFEVRRALESAAAEPAAVLMSDADADALMQDLDTLGDDPTSTRSSPRPRISSDDRGRQRESRALFTDRRTVRPHSACQGVARVDPGGRRHPDDSRASRHCDGHP